MEHDVVQDRECQLLRDRERRMRHERDADILPYYELIPFWKLSVRIPCQLFVKLLTHILITGPRVRLVVYFR